ncbi:MAG: hydrogenase small subunit [Acidobacteria bacterium]|nr:hydrogenase small subunit [Acidobacteriota bacterium]
MIACQPATTSEVLERRGISRRDILTFCTMMAASLGLPKEAAAQIANALDKKPRIPVLWIHGLECTCCSESFIRSTHPIAQDILFNMISLDYDDTLQAAAGHQAEEIRRKIMKDYKGQYLLAVEGNAPTNDGGVYCTIGGETFTSILEEAAAGAKAIIAWGSCASNGCVQAAYPNPTGAKPVYKMITDKPVINVPGCPPIAEVMTGVLSYILTFDRLPELDSAKRPKMFYGQRIHDRCYRRSYFDAGQFVEAWDDEGGRKGWCLYKMGCRGPSTYNACASMKWNECVSFPIGSGHGCFGCSEEGFWDNGPFYERLANIPNPTTDLTADRIGLGLTTVVAGAIAAHGVAALAKHKLVDQKLVNIETSKPVE